MWLAHSDAQLSGCARLPQRLGSRVCTVHEGELAALLSCVAAAPLHQAVLIGVDRLPLIQLVQALPQRTRAQEVRANCLPLESRKHCLQNML